MVAGIWLIRRMDVTIKRLAGLYVALVKWSPEIKTSWSIRSVVVGRT